MVHITHKVKIPIEEGNTLKWASFLGTSFYRSSSFMSQVMVGLPSSPKDFKEKVDKIPPVSTQYFCLLASSKFPPFDSS